MITNVKCAALCVLLIGAMFSLCAMETTYIPDVQKFLDLSKDSLGKSILPDEVINFLNKTDETVVLDVSHQQWHSSEIMSFTERLSPLEKRFPKLCMIDLSHNSLDRKAAAALLVWLRLPTLHFMNLKGNPLSLQKIGELYEELVRMGLQSGELLALMRKIIFMSAEHITEAATKSLYRTLVEINRIPADWAQIHQNYYMSSLLLSFNRYKNAASYDRFLTQVKELAPTETLNTSATVESEDMSCSDEELEMSFFEAYSKLSPNMDFENIQ